MPDADVIENLESSVEDQTTQRLPPEDELMEDEQEQSGAEQEDRAAYEAMWEEIAPELASELNELSPEARERYLLKRLAAMQAAKAANVDESAEDTTTDNGNKTARAPFVEIPTLDQEEIVSVATKAIEDGEVGDLANLLVKYHGYVKGMASLVNSALEEQDGKINQFAKPAQIRAVIGKVKGATEDDVASALKLLDSGDAGTPLAALKLAVLDRYAETSGREPSPKRRAAGQRASLASATSRREGAPAIRIPTSPEEEKDAMRLEEEAARKKK